jgi:hypothetical protein
LREEWRLASGDVNVDPPQQAPTDERLRLVYAEALRGITQQQQVLDNLRGRSALLLSAGAVATSFLGAYAFPDRRGGLVVAAAVAAAVLFVAVLGLTLWTLRPRDFKFRDEPQKLIREWVDSEQHYSLDDVHRHLADWLGEHYDKNQKTIDCMLKQFTWACGCLGAEVVLLLILALTKGSVL